MERLFFFLKEKKLQIQMIESLAFSTQSGRVAEDN